MEFHNKAELRLNRMYMSEELNFYYLCYQLLPTEGRIRDELHFGLGVIRRAVNKARDPSQLAEQECSQSFPCALALCLREFQCRDMASFSKHFLSERV